MVLMLGVELMGLVLLRGKCSVLGSVRRGVLIDDYRWDPASGLGTPNYPLMKELFLSLP